MNWIRNYTPHLANNRLYRIALTVTIAGNVLLAAGKGTVAYLTGSAAIYADAANSVSDVLYSILMVLGLWMAMRPPDISHPQGHSRFEPLVGMTVAMSMGFAGYEAARTSIERFIQGGEVIQLGLPTLVLLVSALIKACMFVIIRRIAYRVNSPTLRVTAQDNLSDVLTSIAAFLGVAGSSYVSPLLDPIAGMAVAVWIFRTAFGALRENLNFLTGAGASEELRNEIVEAAASVPGVLRVHHTMTEYVGPQLVVDMHVNVDGSMRLDETHKISDEVIARIEAIPEVDRAYVHIEPEGYD